MTVEFTLATGTKTACMARANTHGQMADVTKVSIIWTKRMVSGFTPGLMAGSTRVIGLWVSNMARVSTINPVNCLKVEFGAMENALLGNRRISIPKIILYDLFFT